MIRMSAAYCFILLLQIIEYAKPCADIVLVLDGSGSIKQQFERMINMANDVAKQFDIEKKGHRVAILEFSSTAIISKWLRYPFDRIKTNDEMKKVIQNLPHIRRTTHAGRALGVVLQEFLPQRRPGSPFLVFVITDGYYRDSKEAQQNVANLAAKPNVQLFAATFSKLNNMRGLLLLVNNDSSHIIANTNSQDSSWNALKPFSECLGLKTSIIPKKLISSSTATNNTSITTSSITAAIKHQLNEQRNLKNAKLSQDLVLKNDTFGKFPPRSARFVGTPSIRAINNATQSIAHHTTATTRNIPVKSDIKPECLLDVVFLMDFSGGTSDKRNIYIDLVSNLIRSLNLNQTSAHVAAIYYSGPKRARTQFHLRKHSTTEEAIKDLHQAPSNGGTTRTGEAIYYAINEFDEKFGARKGARKMMIIFTDGYSQDDTTEASQAAHSKGIELKVVSVEDENLPPDMQQIIAIAGDASDTYSSKDFKKLQSHFDEYSRRCKL
uniref:VWFA domain-containing protein n=1 Tax=Elaeophora elaphi TaxID=1147741 RepID=A0A158Q887_9BILA